MAIQATSTPPLSPCRYLTENQQEIATRKASRATMYNVAAVVSAIAVVAISGGLTAFFLGLLSVETSLSSWAMIGVIATFCGAGVSMNIFLSWAKSSSETSIAYQQYADKFREIKESWTQNDILQFFATNNIDTEKYASQTDLKILFPLIARFKVAEAWAKTETAEANKQLPGLNAENSTKELRKMHLDFYNQHTAKSREYSLQAAFYLQHLQNPALIPPVTDSKLSEILKENKPFAGRVSAILHLHTQIAELPTTTNPLGSFETYEPRDIRPLLFA